MTKSPQNEKVVILSPGEIKAKFEELDMMTFLSTRCERRTIRRSTKTRADRRFTAERGENWLRKDDGESQAIYYWWRVLTGGEEYSVEQFTAPDGTFYTTETIKHPGSAPKQS